MKKREPGPMLSSYPHVVIRWMACAYDSRPVVFRRAGMAAATQSNAIEVLDPPAADDVDLIPRRRAALLAKLCELSARTGRRMCAVFSKADTVYVEPDGTMNTRREAPSGGVAPGAFSLEKTRREPMS